MSTAEFDYTEETGPIVRAGRWPPAGGSATIILTRTENGVALAWPAGAIGWTWQLLLSRNQYGGTPDLILTSTSNTLPSTNVLQLCFHATVAQTTTLPGTDRRRFYVHVRSNNGGVYGFYAYGRAEVESAVGEA